MRRLLPVLWLAGCATTPPAAPAPQTKPALPEEKHLSELQQLSFGGENAEAYWRFDSKGLSLQVKRPGEACDRIHTFMLGDAASKQISSGKGATTCAHFFPGDQELLYASTHLGGDACPPKPDMREGYVWAIYETYDIFKANADGSNLRQLTTSPGYDAEGTVCAKDGSILFTSVRDGDLELYRMDKDGQNVKRLTFTPGYDGGAFFNADCTKIVWRASRPQPGRELEDYQSLLKRNLVRPSKLELYVANADGSDAKQITDLGSASFAPFFTPDSKRVLFSTNYPNPRGREFDIWAIDVDGTNLERITSAPGFDGFPMFSPDGQWLAFSSNRATSEGQNDTNLFLAKWKNDRGPIEARTQDAVKADVEWLADPAREGRGILTKGLAASAEHLAERFKALGLAPAGENGSYLQPFELVTALTRAKGTTLVINGQTFAETDFTPVGWSGEGSAKGDAVFVDYGIVDEEPKRDDFAELDLKGKVVIARRFAPDLGEKDTPKSQRRRGDLRKKAFHAKQKGAVALVVVDLPAPLLPVAQAGEKLDDVPPDARLPGLEPEGTGDAGIPVVVVKRDAFRKVLDAFKGKPTLKKAGSLPKLAVQVTVQLDETKTQAANVVGDLVVDGADAWVVLGAHYDHLGLGGRDSLAPDVSAPHLGADDNASGVAALLEAARALAAKKDGLPHSVRVVAFAGEESGVLGSSHFVRTLKNPASVRAMLNLDMVGRLRGNQLTVLGSETATEWPALIQAACGQARVGCDASGDGYGPSDHMPFYTAGIPVLHLFTGAHSDYHKPSDSADKLNYTGIAQTARVMEALTRGLPKTALAYQKVAAPVRGDVRSFGASLGTVPDYAGPPKGTKGMLLADVRPGGGAALGGMKKGDLVIKLGSQEIGSVEDLMFVLMGAKPGQTVKAIVVRDGKEVPLEVTFQEGRRR